MLDFRGQRLRLTLALTAALAWVLQGYDQALMNGFTIEPQFLKQFPSIDTLTPELRAQNAKLQGTVVSLFEVGAAVGALSAYFLGDRLGRKWTTFTAAVTALIGIVLQTASFQIAQLIVGRIIGGLGVGLFTATVPAWVGECATAHQRGSLILIEGAGAIFGIMFVGWLELGFYYVSNEASFRFPMALQALVPVVLLVAVPYLVESPRWLMSKDRDSDAAAVLAKLTDEPEVSPAVTDQMRAIRASLELEQRGHTGGPFARTPNRHLNRTVIAIAVNILARLAGVDVIIFYSNSTLVQALGFSNQTARIISGCLQTWQFFTTVCSVFLIDRFGRRKLMISAAAVMCLAQAGLAGLQSDLSNRTAASCSIIFYFIVLTAFPIGLFMVPFLYSSEIAPLKIRTKVTAMSACFNWLFNFLIAEVTPIAFDRISWRYYLVFVGTNALSVIVFYLFLPETKDRSLEEIDDLFLAANNAFQPVRLARILPMGGSGDEDGGDLQVEKARVQVEKHEHAEL